eukprot:361100-Chlamydomonas_euryale.AAC.30
MSEITALGDRYAPRSTVPAEPEPILSPAPGSPAQPLVPSMTRLDGRVAVADVGSNASDVSDIVQSQVGDQLVHLEQQAQRLADAAGRAQQRHLAGLHRHRAAAASRGRAHSRPHRPH